MPAHVTRRTDTPAIVTTFDGDADASAVFDAYLRTAEMARESEPAVPWVIDVRRAETTYSQVVAMWLEIMRGMGGASVQPELNGAFVASRAMAPLFADLNVPCFETVDRALAYLRPIASAEALSA